MAEKERTARRYLWLGLSQLAAGTGGLILAAYYASWLMANELYPPPPPDQGASWLEVVPVVVVIWAGLLILFYFIVAGANNLSRYKEQRWLESLLTTNLEPNL